MVCNIDTSQGVYVASDEPTHRIVITAIHPSRLPALIAAVMLLEEVEANGNVRVERIESPPEEDDPPESERKAPVARPRTTRKGAR